MTIGGRNWKDVGLGLLEAALVLTAAFSLLTAFDEWHRLLALFAHFRLQYLAIAVILTVAFLWLRWAGYVALGVATIALNAWYVVPWYLPVERSEASESDVRILNANVLASNGNHEDFRRLVETTDPDLVILQEATSAWVNALDDMSARYPHQVVEASDNPYGVALFSKLPLEASAVRHAEPLGHPEIIATVVAKGWRFQLIVTHPPPPISSSGAGARNLQLAGVAKLAQRTPTPLVIAGDLNITMWENHYRKLVGDTGLRNAREGFGVAPTWPLFFPPAMIPIDHFLVSGDIEVTDFRTGPGVGSDHLPISVSIRARSESRAAERPVRRKMSPATES